MINRTSKRLTRAALLALGASALLGMLLSPAVAGSKTTFDVYVGTSNAYGLLGAARNSPDTRQYIGCGTTSSGGTPTATCYVSNKVGTNKVCTTTNTWLVDAAKSISGDSYVAFNWNGGTCTRIHVINNSTYEPKRP